MSDQSERAPEPEVYAVGGTHLAIGGHEWEVAAACDRCDWTGTVTMRPGVLVNHYRHKCGGYVLLGTPEERAEMGKSLRRIRKAVKDALKGSQKP